MENIRIAIIGAGAMGGAVARGLVKAGYAPGLITVANPHEDKLAPLAEAGVRVTTDNAEALRDASLVIFAVKPWILPSVAATLREHINPEKQEICAIVAGVPGADLAAMFGNPPALSIVMPNTAVALRESMTFIVEVNGQAPLATELFGLLGRAMVIGEKLLPAATALASCGIAYAMRYVRAASEGGVQLGFRASEAQAIVAETLRGAAALLSQPGAHAEAEIDKVTTPGGLTIRGLNAMEKAGFTPAVIAGLTECVK